MNQMNFVGLCLVMATWVAQSSGDCQGNMAFRAKQYVLVGFAVKVVGASSIEDCARQCIQVGKSCSSGMFYPKNTKDNCVLNSQTRGNQPDKYVQEDQDTVEYFEPCNNAAGAATTTTTATATSGCQGNFAFRAKQYTLMGSAEKVANAKDIEDCVRQCIQMGKSCNSGMFYPKITKNNCIMNSQTRRTNPDTYTQEKQDTVEYFEPCKNAVGATTTTSGCQGNFGFRAKQYTLVGSANKVVDAKDIDDCVSQCVRFGSGCSSGLFYSKEKKNNCVLNSKNRSTQPSAYTQEKQDTVEYFEPCQTIIQASTTSTSQCQRNMGFRAKQFTMIGFADKVVDAKDIEDCARQCVQLGSTCSSGLFYSKEKKQNCILNSKNRSAQPSAYVPEKQDTVEYFEPCQASASQSSQTIGCQGDVAYRAEQKILIGANSKTVTAVNLDDCARQCVQIGKSCSSGMYYSEQKQTNCVLNSKTRTTNPDTYTDEPQAKVEYFEPCKTSGQCQGKIGFRAKDRILVGIMDQTVDAKDIDDCARQCALKKYASGVFFAKETKQNCILTKQTRSTKPDRFVEPSDKNDNAEYFEPCPNRFWRLRL